MQSQRYIFLVCSIFFILAIVSCTSYAESTDSIEQTPIISGNNPIVVGDVSNRIDEVTVFWQPFADYLAAKLANQGITHGVVRVAPDLNTMSDWLRTGEVDIYIDSLYPSIVVSSTSDSEILLRHWRDYVEEYHSVFFTTMESGISSLADLQGRIVAYDRPFSTSGYFLPTIYLIENGFSLVEVSERNSTVRDDNIGYIFANDDINVINWVIAGHVDVGVTNNFEYAYIPEQTRDKLLIIAETESVPSQVVSVRPDIEEGLVTALTTTLIQMDGEEDGLVVLQQIETQRFDNLPNETDEFMSRMDGLLSMVTGE